MPSNIHNQNLPIAPEREPSGMYPAPLIEARPGVTRSASEVTRLRSDGMWSPSSFRESNLSSFSSQKFCAKDPSSL